MSTSNRLSDLERHTELLLTQLAGEVQGCRQAIGLLARGIDANDMRLARLEKALANAAQAQKEHLDGE